MAGLTFRTGQLAPAIQTDSSNNIGIGGAAGTYKLSVTGTGNFTGALTGTSATFSSTLTLGNVINFQNGGTTYFQQYAGGGGDLVFYNTTNNGVYFYTNSVNRLAILGNGNVGIGTSSPIDLLHLAGGMTSTGLSVPSNTSIGSIQIGYDGTNGVIRSWNSSPIIYSTYGYHAFQTSGTERMRITSGGNVLIGQTVAQGNANGIYLRAGIESGFTTTNDIVLQLDRLGSTGDILTFYQAGTKVGSVSVTGATTSYNVTSDYRLKQDFKSFNGLNLIDSINVYDYQWKYDNTRMYGVIAHELQEVLPYAVIGEKDAINKDGSIKAQGVDYSKIVPVLVKAIQEQNQLITDLNERLSKLENK